MTLELLLQQIRLAGLVVVALQSLLQTVVVIVIVIVIVISVNMV